MIAIMATRPLAISADSFLVFTAGPEEGSTFSAKFTRPDLCDVLAEEGGVLHEVALGEDLCAAQLRHLGDCREAYGDVCVLQARRRGQDPGNVPMTS